MLKLVKAKQTKWEELEAKKQEKIHAKETMQRLLEAAEAERKEALVAGKDIAQPREVVQKAKDTLEALEEEINSLEQEQSDPSIELEYLQAKLQELERQEQKVADELEPHREAYKKAEAEFKKAEQVWFAQYAKAQEEFNRIARQKGELRPRMDRLTPEAEPEPQHSVAEWLELCREGKVRSYLPGSDPNLDEAYKLYEQEKDEIRRWATKAAIAKASDGETPVMPECAKHYSRARLKELTKKGPGGGTSNFRGYGSGKVSI